MDWKKINFDWNRARAFLVAAEERSFSAGAKALNITQSTLGRQVAALEEELGVALFERIGNGIEITPSGLDLIEHVKVMAEAAGKFSIAATGKSDEIEGRVSITGSEATSAYLLPEFLKILHKKQPKITVEIVASNESKDLRRREADIAVRNHRSEHPDLISRKVKASAAYLYASKEFVKKFGPFKNKKSLCNMPFVGMSNNVRWQQALIDLGIDVDDRSFPFITDNHLVHWNIVKSGMAIGTIPEFAAKKDITVERVLKSLPGLPIDTWVVSHRELKTNKRIRVVFDLLVDYLNSL